MIKVKRYLAIFIIALVLLGITTRAFCYEAEVIDISGTKYFPAVKEALSKAKGVAPRRGLKYYMVFSWLLKNFLDREFIDIYNYRYQLIATGNFAQRL